MEDKKFLKLSDLRNWDKNPRAIKKEDFERLKKQIKELGQYKPLLVTPDGEVLGGNMRLRAYKELGIEDVWVSIVEPKTDADKVKYALSDNDRAGYYVEQDLAELIQEYGLEINLEDYKVDLGNALTLAELLNQFAPDIKEDEPPPIPEGEPESKLGEVYHLGKHRLMCGDATKIEDVEKLMGGQKADMVFTDPPYGMNFTGSVHADGTKSFNAKHGAIKNDDDPAFLASFIPSIKLFNKGAFYIFYYRLKVDLLMNSLKQNGLEWRNLIFWKKNNFTLSNSDYKSQYEPIVFGWADDAEPIIYGWSDEHQFYGSKGERDVWELPSVWEIDRTKRNSDHPTMKPQALCARGILNSSKQGQIVLDLFGGSGSTLIACEQLGRNCYMMELDPKYCDVIRKRYVNYREKTD